MPYKRLVPLAVLALLATGCGSGSGESAAAAVTTIKDPKGHAVAMPAQPKAALGFYTTDVDILITLGIPLAKSQPIRGDSGFTTFPDYFPQEPLKGVKPFANYPEYNYEQTLKAEPDFILNGLGYDDKVHPRLGQIAPTYTVDAFDGKNWEVHFKRTAQDLGRTDRYDAWKGAYDKQVAQAKADIAKAGNSDLTVATFGYWEGNGNIACYAGVACKAFDDLGLKRTPLSDDDKLSISPEQMGKLAGIDVVWVSVGVGEEGKKELATMLGTLGQSPAWRALPFVKNKRIYTYNMEIAYGSPSGQQAFVEQVRKDLTANPNLAG
ncbi:ABC transporter substrate-binding protein [Nonomuraea sp. NPDC059007]|uniref:ABC transporter substrate-binding protein n=1 Tax=Nonomuraea sp. NPDC059007 TaxID=3346692 RepID=UPI0036A16A80